MLALRPPQAAIAPGYPVRADLLADAAQRRRVLAVLAAPTLALALHGCGAPTPEPLGGVIAPPQPPPTERPQPAPDADDDAVPRPLPGAMPAQPPRLLGEVSAPQPPATVPLRETPAATE